MMKTDKNKMTNSADELMTRAFSLPAPAMPDFAAISRNGERAQELNDEELDFLAAAGISGEINLRREKAHHPVVFPDNDIRNN